MIVTVADVKGGVGKTTSAGTPLAVTVTSLPAARLADRLPAAVLLVKVRSGTRAVGASGSAPTDDDVRVVETRIPLREALALAWGDPVTLL